MLINFESNVILRDLFTCVHICVVVWWLDRNVWNLSGWHVNNNWISLQISFFFYQCNSLFCLFLWASVSLSALVVIMCSPLALWYPECIVAFTRDWLCALEGDDLMYSADIQDMHRQMLLKCTRHTSPRDGVWWRPVALLSQPWIHTVCTFVPQVKHWLCCLSASRQSTSRLSARSNSYVYAVMWICRALRQGNKACQSVSHACWLWSPLTDSHTQSAWSPGRSSRATGSTYIMHQCLQHMIMIPLSCLYLRVCVCVCGKGLSFIFSLMRYCFTLSLLCM